MYGVRHEQARKLTILLGSIYISNGLHYIKTDASMAKNFFRKAIVLHQDALKTLVDIDSAENSDDEDIGSDMGSVHTVATNGKDSNFGSPVDRASRIAAIKAHVLLLKLAYQRYGGWPRQAAEYERLTSKVWAEFGSQLGLKEDQVVTSKWSATGYGGGKAENNTDDWKIPVEWSILKSN